jgi:hypothetical protein
MKKKLNLKSLCKTGDVIILKGETRLNKFLKFFGLHNICTEGIIFDDNMIYFGDKYTYLDLTDLSGYNKVLIFSPNKPYSGIEKEKLFKNIVNSINNKNNFTLISVINSIRKNTIKTNVLDLENNKYYRLSEYKIK